MQARELTARQVKPAHLIGVPGLSFRRDVMVANIGWVTNEGGDARDFVQGELEIVGTDHLNLKPGLLSR